MRRVGLLILGLWVAVFGLAPAAVAAAAPTPVCTITEPGISGLESLRDGGYAVVNHSSTAAAMRVFLLNNRCGEVRSIAYPAANPARDPEDLAVASDGTLWVGDTGDTLTPGSTEHRQTIALWRVPSSGTPTIYRLTYPDGPHDAGALLFGPGDTPVIVTKEPSGAAGLYQPTRRLEEGTHQGVPLRKVGTWSPTRTGTANALGTVGQLLVTGAAQAPDRKRVVLRTYSDAYEWDVPDGDVVKAISTGKPRITPLPNEPQGKAIAYTADGHSFLTVSDLTGPAQLLRYQPSTATTVAPAGGTQATPKADTRSWLKRLTLPDIINIVAGIGVLGLILVVVGVVGIRRSRQQRRLAADTVEPDDDDDDVPPGGSGSVGPPVTVLPPLPTSGSRGGTTYGGSGRSGPPPAAGSGGRTGGRPGAKGAASVPAPGAPPSSVQPGYGAQPGYGGGSVYGGRNPAGFDQGNGRPGGRQEYSQPGYHPGDRY